MTPLTRSAETQAVLNLELSKTSYVEAPSAIGLPLARDPSILQLSGGAEHPPSARNYDFACTPCLTRRYWSGAWMR
jgi:hypothetical protein